MNSLSLAIHLSSITLLQANHPGECSALKQ
jgi:hypothetical protein